VDRFVFVSHWQASAFVALFGLPSARAGVIGNPVPEVFLGLFPPGTPILAAKDPDLLVYASAPNRGLEGLVRYVLPELRRSRPALRLEIYSGFYLDQGLSYRDAKGGNADQMQEAWLAEAQGLPGVTVSRGVPKTELARRFGRAAMLCYPCVFRETFCSVAREAMAAGCLVVTSTAGALPETTAGFATLVPARATPDQFAELEVSAFTRAALQALESRDRTPDAVERRLALQTEFVRANSSPAVVGGMWLDLLETA
jgi:glycosyltransferase involved in cell wall biosynthesis